MRRFVSHRQRPNTGNTGLHHAALGMITVFGAVGIAQMNFDAGDAGGESVHRGVHNRLHGCGGGITAMDVVI